MKDLFRKIVEMLVVAIVLILIVIVTLTPSVISMIFLGLEYDSILKLVLFFAALFMIELPFDLVVDSMPKYLNLNISKNKIYLIQFILGMLLDIVTLSILDYFVESIYAPFRAIIVFSLINAVIVLILKKFDDDEVETDEKENE